MPAVLRVQGETDSYGSEMVDLCAACHEQERKEDEASKHGTCDWCRKPSDSLRTTRDYDEGSCGPVYRICTSCSNKREKEDREELAWMHRNDEECFVEDELSTSDWAMHNNAIAVY
jgi:hypothetical protein